MHLDVLYHSASILVVNKPSGLLVHRGWGRESLVLVDLVRDLTGADRVHPVQRLDRGASGAIVFALDPDTARMLQDLEDFEKSYLALVRGRPAGVSGPGQPRPAIPAARVR